MPKAELRPSSPIRRHKTTKYTKQPLPDTINSYHTNHHPRSPYHHYSSIIVAGRSCLVNESFEQLIPQTCWPLPQQTNSAIRVTKPPVSVHSQGKMSDSHNRDTKDRKRSSKPTPSTRRPTGATENRPQRGRRTAPTSTHRCDICNQYYSRRDNLRVHQRVHSGEMPYECRYCGQRFRWMGALRSHESNHARDGHSLRLPRDDSTAQSPVRQTSSRTLTATSNRHSAMRGPPSRPPGSRQTSSHTQSGQSKTSSSRDQKHGPSTSRNRPQVPIQFSQQHMFFGQDILVTEEDPGVSPILQEPWHDVLDDNHH